jgi:hypothetical protein
MTKKLPLSPGADAKLTNTSDFLHYLSSLMREVTDPIGFFFVRINGVIKKGNKTWYSVTTPEGRIFCIPEEWLTAPAEKRPAAKKEAVNAYQLWTVLFSHAMHRAGLRRSPETDPWSNPYRSSKKRHNRDVYAPCSTIVRPAAGTAVILRISPSGKYRLERRWFCDADKPRTFGFESGCTQLSEMDPSIEDVARYLGLDAQKIRDCYDQFAANGKLPRCKLCGSRGGLHAVDCEAWGTKPNADGTPGETLEFVETPLTDPPPKVVNKDTFKDRSTGIAREIFEKGTVSTFRPKTCECGHDLVWHVGPDGVGLGSGPACHCGCECFKPKKAT